MTPDGLHEAAAAALMLRGDDARMTLTTPAGMKMPAGFPAGKLLSVNPRSRARNMSFPAKRVIAWLVDSGLA